VHASTRIDATEDGVGSERCQAAASRYVRPSDRSLAPSQAGRNQGCSASCRMNCCPTIPVAPRMPTSILRTATLLDATNHSSQNKNAGLFCWPALWVDVVRVNQSSRAHTHHRPAGPLGPFPGHDGSRARHGGSEYSRKGSERVPKGFRTGSQRVRGGPGVRQKLEHS
jgi:hypothetical protein